MTPDRTLRRVAPKVWLGGSPLKLFRLTEAGDRLLAGMVESGSWDPNTTGEVELRDRLVDAAAVHPAPCPIDAQAFREPVTVVIPVRDDIPGLAALLDDLHEDASRVGAPRIVVVDDGSDDARGVSDLAVSNGAAVVRHDHPQGPAAARNSGLAIVDTPLVAFVDADVRVPAGWLDLLQAHLGDPRVVAVAPRIRNAGGRGALARYDNDRGPLDLGADPAPVRPLSRVAYVPSAALVVRTAAALVAGGFDEQLRFGEDVDFVWRLVDAGGSVRYEPAVVLTHRPRDSLRGWFGQRVAYGSSAAELHMRHPGAVAPLVLSPWSAMAWAVTALGHPVSGIGIAIGSAALPAKRLPALGPAHAVGMALRGHLGAGTQIARALIRPWWPITLGAMMVSRRAGRIAVVAVLTHVVTTPGAPATRVLALADDVAYSIGVFKGVLRVRNPGALMPTFARRSGSAGVASQ